MGTFLQDLRYGARILVRFPGVTLAALLALALGTAVLVSVAAVLRYLVPALRASRVDAAVALRSE